MIQVILIGILVLLTFFLIIYETISNYYKKQRIRLVKLIKKDIIKTIENVETLGYEENGWKHNFPSSTGWERSTLFICKDFMVVSPKSNFPFFYKSELQPFIIAKDMAHVKSKLSFSRVYRPLNVDINDLINELVITIKPSGLLGQLKLHLTFKNIDSEDLKLIGYIKNWP